MSAQSSKELANLMSEKLSSMTSIEVEFSFAAYSKGDKDAFQQGQFDVQGDAFKISTFGFILLCDGKNKWIFDEQASEVVIMKNDPTKSEITENPFAVLTAIDSCFEMVGSPKKVKGENGSLQMISLKPKDSQLNYTLVRILIDTADNLPVSIEYISKDDVTYIANVLSLKEVKKRPDSYFIFDPSLFKDIVITDLR